MAFIRHLNGKSLYGLHSRPGVKTRPEPVTLEVAALPVLGAASSVLPRQAPILLADDDENDVFLMRRAFQEAGLRVPLVVVGNGLEAIHYLNAEGIYADRQAYPWPCLLLLDLKMPLLDGFEVLTWLHKRRHLQPLRVVVLSSSQQEADIQRALALGADAYCAKPHGFYEMVSIARGLHQQLQQLPSVPSGSVCRRFEERC